MVLNKFFLKISLRKPRTQRAKRALEHRGPKLVENTKSVMFIRGGNTSAQVTQSLKDLVNIQLKNKVVWYNKFRITK